MDDELAKLVRWLRANGMLSGYATGLAHTAKDGEAALVALYRGATTIEPRPTYDRSGRPAAVHYLVMDRDDFPVAIRPTVEDAIANIAAHHRAYLKEHPQADHDRLHALSARYILPISADGIR